MGFMSPDVDEGAAAAEEYERRKKIQAGTKAIESQFAGFDKPFYDARSQAYQSFAMPQVDDQYQKAGEELKYALARQFGTSDLADTSVGAERQAELARQYALGKTGIAQKGQEDAQQAQSGVEAQRSALLGQLQQTVDPAAAATASLRASEMLNKPDTFAPIGDMFYNITEGLASASPSEGMIAQIAPRAGTGTRNASKYKYLT